MKEAKAFAAQMAKEVEGAGVHDRRYTLGEYLKYWVDWVDRTGQITGPIGPPQRRLQSPRLSPDETRIAASAGEFRWEIWIFEVVRDNAIPLVRNEATSLDPYWFPDGQKVLFRRWAKAEPRVFARPVDEVGAEEQLFEGFPLQLSRSGKYVLVTPSPAKSGIAAEPRIKLSYVSLADPDRKLVALPDAFQKIDWPKLSPDDDLLAYVSSETGQDEVWVVAFPGFTNKTIVSRGGGRGPWWHPKGSELFYRSLDGRTLMSLTAKRARALQWGVPTKVFDLPDSISGRDFDVTSAGQRFVMIRTVWAESEAERLPKPDALVVQNWFEEFRKK
jgi:hypothetical protein